MVVPVKYLPDVIVRREIIPNFIPKITKRDLRKKRIKELKAKIETPTSELHKYDDEEDDTKEETPPPPTGFNLLIFYHSCKYDE